MKKDPTQFRERFNRWKSGQKVYEAGKPIESYEGGKSDEISGGVLPEVVITAPYKRKQQRTQSVLPQLKMPTVREWLNEAMYQNGIVTPEKMADLWKKDILNITIPRYKDGKDVEVPLAPNDNDTNSYNGYDWSIEPFADTVIQQKGNDMSLQGESQFPNNDAYEKVRKERRNFMLDYKHRWDKMHPDHKFYANPFYNGKYKLKNYFIDGTTGGFFDPDEKTINFPIYTGVGKPELKAPIMWHEFSHAARHANGGYAYATDEEKQLLQDAYDLKEVVDSGYRPLQHGEDFASNTQLRRLLIERNPYLKRGAAFDKYINDVSDDFIINAYNSLNSYIIPFTSQDREERAKKAEALRKAMINVAYNQQPQENQEYSYTT